MIGKTALKSKRTVPPNFSFKLIVMAASSISKMFINMDLPFRKPRCIELIQLLDIGSHSNLMALASSLLSVFTIDNGLVSLAP